MKNFIGILALSFLGGLNLPAQTSYTLASTSECTIEGTSTLHNWTAKVDDFNGFLVLGKEFSTEKGPKMGAEIEQASLTLQSKKHSQRAGRDHGQQYL